MTYAVDREIARFAALSRTKDAPGLVLEPLCEHGVLVRPAAGGLAPQGKRIGLTMMGVIHGNELAGLAVVNELLTHLLSGVVRLRIPVAFLLGNPEASRANVRYLERDLNRSFNRDGDQTHEERRALALGAVLRDTAYFVDYHQVVRPSQRPFFIFPYAARGYELARAIGPRHTIVTHWGRSFSAEGMCSDEYVNSHGGTGISFELGQNGFDPYQIAVGIDAGLRAIQVVTTALEKGALPAASAIDAADRGELYTWAEIVPWPAGEYVELRPGWNNFDEVEAGATLGTVDGRPIVTAHAGRILFPKYVSREDQRSLRTRPTELCRVMRRIEPSDLPPR